MQTRPPSVSRRRVLAGAAALVALGATAVTSTACGSTPPPEPDLDDLTTALDLARADSQLAADAATARGSMVDELSAVAAERSAHADALADEIVRMTGQAAPTTSVTSTTTTAASPPPAVPPVPTVADVVGALRASADNAAQAAATLSGYRAGLLGSIAAACTASYQVALTPQGGNR